MISAVIITKNEYRVIRECVESCLQFTDDVVVLDSGSTDDTVAIANQAGARVYENEWLGYGPQKNLANSFSKYDWILSIDADERPDQKMILTLAQLKLNPKNIYCFKLVDHFDTRPIRFSELRPKWKKRLFNKTSVRWDEREVHEQLVFENGSSLEHCSGLILHYSYIKFEDFEKKIEQYAILGAQEMRNNNKRLHLFKKLINPAFRFIRSYILYGGFLEGTLGFKISRTLARGLRLKYTTYEKLDAIK
jgi:glycosyltransferase involved in cell wall biosynthesis